MPQVDEIILVTKNNKGVIELTEKDLNKIIQLAYDKGYQAGRDAWSWTSITGSAITTTDSLAVKLNNTGTSIPDTGITYCSGASTTSETITIKDLASVSADVEAHS